MDLSLSRYLSIDELRKKYCESSKYYCFAYKMSIDEIIFDDRGKLDDAEKVDYLLMQIAMSILSYVKEERGMKMIAQSI